jgi:hypothetical protein
MTPSKAPIEWANIVAAIVAGLSLGVAMGWLSLSGEQFSEIERFLGSMGVVVAPIGAALWARLQVTPLAEPRDTDGEILIKPSGLPANKVQERAKAEWGRN